MTKNNNIDVKSLIIIRGVSGAGKTSFAKFLGFPYFEADSFFYDKSGNYCFDAKLLHRAHKFCYDSVELAMKNGEPKIIQSNTNTRESEIIPYIELAEKYNYKVFVLVIEKRHDGTNQHGLEKEKIEQMKERLYNSIKLI